MYMCTIRVISPLLSRQACCAPRLARYSDDAVTGTVCVTSLPHTFTGSEQKSVEKRFKCMQILFKESNHSKAATDTKKSIKGAWAHTEFFFGGVVAADSLGKCRRLKGNLDKSLIRLNFFAILS